MTREEIIAEYQDAVAALAVKLVSGLVEGDALKELQKSHELFKAGLDALTSDSPQPTEELALAMRAGARAIVNNKRYEGATFVWDFRGEMGGPKEIKYYDAAILLSETADSLQKRTQGEPKPTFTAKE